MLFSLSFNRSRERALSNYRRLVRFARLKTAPTGFLPFNWSVGQDRQILTCAFFPFLQPESRAGALELQAASPICAVANRAYGFPSAVNARLPLSVGKDRLILTLSMPNGQDRAILTYRVCPAQRNPTKPRRRGLKPRLPAGGSIPFNRDSETQRCSSGAPEPELISVGAV